MELDDNLEISKIDFYGYSMTLKYVGDHGNVHIGELGTHYDSYCMPERQRIAYDILDRDMDGVSFIGIEDYAYGKATGSDDRKSMGMVFQIGEFCGGIKHHFYMKGIGIIAYGIMQIKRYATGSGTASKVEMCNAMKKSFPELYPDYFNELPQYESPMADMVDAFWMCNILRNHLKFEKFGPESVPEPYRSLLTCAIGKDAQSLVDYPLMKLGVPYEKTKRKRKPKKTKA